MVEWNVPLLILVLSLRDSSVPTKKNSLNRCKLYVKHQLPIGRHQAATNKSVPLIAARRYRVIRCPGPSYKVSVGVPTSL